ncbi:MAG: alpha/beta hydrolase-fold protein [Bacteroidota bacterium]
MKSIICSSLILLLMLSCQSNTAGKKESEEESVLNVYKGRVIRIDSFQSEYVTARNVDVWLPENYKKLKRYPVLYMHDGQMLFDSTTTWNGQEWAVDEVAHQLMAEGKVDPFIVVGVWNGGPTRHVDYFPRKPFESLPKDFKDSLLATYKRPGQENLFVSELKSDSYLKFLVKELKPYIDENFNTKKKAKDTYIAGSSMGGLISWYAICEYPEVFGAAACLSTHWPGIFQNEGNPIPQAFASYLENNLPDPKSHKIYFDYGTETLDAMYPAHQKKVDNIMEEKGYVEENWKTLVFEGENHSENAWQRRLHIPLEFIMN